MRWDAAAGHWREKYDEAKKHYETNGNLKVPPAYKTSGGYDLSIWLTDLKRRQNHLRDDRFTVFDRYRHEMEKHIANQGLSFIKIIFWYV